MTACVVCQERERDLENNLLSCARCAGRLAGALRQIPVLVDELRGLGYVERDTGLRVRVMPLYEGTHKSDVAEEGRPDPVAHLFPAGPLSGAVRGARVSGSPDARLPIRVDPTDLLARPRNGSLAVAARSPWPDDQVGHLAVATVLDFWVRDWADLRGEGLPPLQTAGERSPAGLLARWLTDRLDWAQRHHPALDEFARDVSDLLGALWGLAGHGAARPKLMEAACPACGLASLQHPFPDAYIECATPDCGRVLTPLEYEEYVMDMRHEIRALDVVAALNGGIHLDVTKLRFAVVTAKQDEDSAFGWGEVLVLLRDGREPFGRERRPKASEIEVFDNLDDVMIRQGQLLREDG